MATFVRFRRLARRSDPGPRVLHAGGPKALACRSASIRRTGQQSVAPADPFARWRARRRGHGGGSHRALPAPGPRGSPGMHPAQPDRRARAPPHHSPPRRSPRGAPGRPSCISRPSRSSPRLVTARRSCRSTPPSQSPPAPARCLVSAPMMGTWGEHCKPRAVANRRQSVFRDRAVLRRKRTKPQEPRHLHRAVPVDPADGQTNR